MLDMDFGRNPLRLLGRAKNYNKKSSSKAKHKTTLRRHNIQANDEDYAYICLFGNIPMTKRNWVFSRRNELQRKSTKSESRVGNLLIEKGIKFIHQAPFIIRERLYYLDFYLPNQNVAIEVDGGYHSTSEMIEQDMARDDDFRHIGIRTVRIQNDLTKSKNLLIASLRALGVMI